MWLIEAIQFAGDPVFDGRRLHDALQGKAAGDYIVFRRDDRVEMLLVDADAEFFARHQVAPNRHSDLLVDLEIAVGCAGQNVWHTASHPSHRTLYHVEEGLAWSKWGGAITGLVEVDHALLSAPARCPRCDGSGGVIVDLIDVEGIGAQPCEACAGTGQKVGAEVTFFNQT